MNTLHRIAVLVAACLLLAGCSPSAAGGSESFPNLSETAQNILSDPPAAEVVEEEPPAPESQADPAEAPSGTEAPAEEEAEAAVDPCQGSDDPLRCIMLLFLSPVGGEAALLEATATISTPMALVGEPVTIEVSLTNTLDVPLTDITLQGIQVDPVYRYR